jgi:hypothetical protein
MLKLLNVLKIVFQNSCACFGAMVLFTEVFNIFNGFNIL